MVRFQHRADESQRSNPLDEEPYRTRRVGHPARGGGVLQGPLSSSKTRDCAARGPTTATLNLLPSSLRTHSGSLKIQVQPWKQAERQRVVASIVEDPHLDALERVGIVEQANREALLLASDVIEGTH